MRQPIHKLLACLLLGWTPAIVHAQLIEQVPAQSSSSSTAAARTAQFEQKLEAISSSLVATQQQLQQSQQQIQQLQEELTKIRKQLASAQLPPVTSSSSVAVTEAVKAETEDIKERQDIQEAQIKLHEQTKTESSSKYPLRITGLILFNSFVNKGVVDNIDLPAIAIRQAAGVSNGSVGASFRQTILGIEGNGPIIARAHTSADISMDFFAGLAYSSYGTSAGIVRMRTASINLDWSNDAVQFGMVKPLISPLSPSSYATVADASLAGAGNLWTWAPQLRVVHRFPVQNERRFQLELGLWDAPSAGYNSSDVFRAPSPGEQTKQPAYESRISYGTATGDRGLQIGFGGYYSRQSYPGGHGNDSWATTGDWRIPLGRGFEISGEGYRGRSLGGLGGGVYKDVISGTDPISGASVTRGLNAIGGWTQFKSRIGESLEVNAAVGQDTAFAGDFHALVLSPTAGPTQLRARNRMMVGNLIFRPKTYLILSPEYRRILTWPIYGAGSTADIFTLTVGYQF